MKEVGKALEYQRQTAKVIRAHCSGKNSTNKYQLSKFPAAETSVNWPSDSQKYEFYINEEGLRELVLASQKPQAVLLAEYLGISVHKHKYMSKENDSIEITMGTFDREETIRQFHLDKYRIDLYFPEHILAIECDEFDHQDRDIKYEVNRQVLLKSSYNVSLFGIIQMLETLMLCKSLTRYFVQLKQSIIRSIQVSC